tara:strand:+ start:2086 stop:2340 length:255 start_codon:yes stop_codon:yes gene_type:complete
MKDKKAAKKLIKRAKKHPDWYTKQEAWYAKMIKKQHERKTDNSNPTGRRDHGLRGKSEQPKQSRQPKHFGFTWVLHKARSLVGL